MDAREVTLSMIQDSGMNDRQVSIKLGMSPRYLSNIIYRGSRPNSDTLARVADACGYDLLVRRRIDEMEILIDPYEG